MATGVQQTLHNVPTALVHRNVQGSLAAAIARVQVGSGAAQQLHNVQGAPVHGVVDGAVTVFVLHWGCGGDWGVKGDEDVVVMGGE